MFIVNSLLFCAQLVCSLDIYPNLGIVLAPKDNLLVFDAFGHVRADLVIQLPSMNDTIDAFDDRCLSKSGIDKKQRVLIDKTRDTNFGEIFHEGVMKKLQEFSTHYVSKAKITRGYTNETEGFIDEIKSRDERQILELFSAGMTLGYLGAELVHKIFGTDTAHEIKEIRSDIKTITKLRNLQINDIYTQIGTLSCKTHQEIVLRHQNLLGYMVRTELEKLDSILFSIHYKIGFNPHVHSLMRKACFKAVSVDFGGYMSEIWGICEDIITKRAFSMFVLDVTTLGYDQISFKIEFIFPTQVQRNQAYDIHNFGYLSENFKGLVGKRISSLDNIDTVLQPLGLGLDKNNCMKLDSYFLCSQEKISPNYMSQNICLNSILKNSTLGCNISEFPIKRPCLVHKIGNTPLIAAAVNYKLLKNVKNANGEISIISTKGVPGLYPISIKKTEQIESLTLLCNNVSKYLNIEPLVLEEQIKINLGPSVIPLIEPVFNMTTFLRDELKVNDLIDNFLDSKFINSISHKDVVYTSIIIILILTTLIFCIFSSKMRTYCKKVKEIELV